MKQKLNNLSEISFLKLFFIFFSLCFIIAAVIMPDRAAMFTGLKTIVTQTCKVATNYFDNGGYSGAFLNAGLVGLICTSLFFLPGAKPNGVSGLAVILTVGFGFWGINVLNIWFAFPGVLLYCLIKKAPIGSQANAMIFTTGLAPLISDLLFRYPGAEYVGWHAQGFVQAILIGLLIGILLPAGLAHVPNMHKGFDLYSAAVALGLISFLLRGILYGTLAGALPAGPDTSLAVASWPISNIFCFVVFGLCILFGALGGCTPKQYWNLMKDTGYGTDFLQKYGNAAALTNVGVFGLFIVLYYNLIGASFNGVTLGIVFCMLSTCFTGSHPRNVWPILVGYVAASFAMKYLGIWIGGGEFTQAINAQAIIIGVCYANGMSPISGKYGWYFGVLAGFLHFCLVTSVPLLHGGFCLYNGGFTAGFICMILVPVLDLYFGDKEKRKLKKAN